MFWWQVAAPEVVSLGVGVIDSLMWRRQRAEPGSPWRCRHSWPLFACCLNAGRSSWAWHAAGACVPGEPETCLCPGRPGAGPGRPSCVSHPQSLPFTGSLPPVPRVRDPACPPTAGPGCPVASQGGSVPCPRQRELGTQMAGTSLGRERPVRAWQGRAGLVPERGGREASRASSSRGQGRPTLRALPCLLTPPRAGWVSSQGLNRSRVHVPGEGRS